MDTFITQIKDQCHRNLMDSDRDDPFGGYSYLRGRGVTEEQMLTFQLGIGRANTWSPKSLRNTPNGKMFNRQFRGTLEGQIVIPIWNASGKLRGLETRLWEETESRKYTQYWLDTWTEDAVFLGLPDALEAIWETGVVYLVEGMFDFFPVQRVFPNTLCTLTAKVMFSQYRFLQRYCKHVVFVYDRDTKGRDVMQDAMDRYNVRGRDGFTAHTLTYPAKDPGQLYENLGIKKFERLLKRKSESFNLYL